MLKKKPPYNIESKPSFMSYKPELHFPLFNHDVHMISHKVQLI